MNKDGLLNIIKYVKTCNNSYSGLNNDIGYHSIEIDGKYRGQRDCIKRLEYCKNVCNFEKKMY